ncbi:type 1 periplasmic-binding domain-containing protein [Thiorhodovibrio frisius]|nr:hypothetical protein [Thiorhodovibrio frisius]
MPQHPLFDITPEHIRALDDEGLRILIARLCKADLRRRGLPVSGVLYGGNQIAADGGIDVRVELPPGTEISGFIPRPATGFQAKADDMPASKIAEEMRPRKTKQVKGTNAPLRASIRALAAAGGAYVIVSSKGSTTDSRLTERRNAMRAAVADLDGSDALHLDFYDCTRMADWVGDYPGEVLWVRERIGQAVRGWHSFGNWSRAPEPVDGDYLSDDTARLWDQRNAQDGPLTVGDGLARLQSILSQAGGIVRLTGLSGTGKTRLLEALFDPRIGDKALDPALAVYADIGAETSQPSVGQLASQLIAEGKRAVLLLDNCPRETHDAIAPVCKSAGSPISLITVDLDIRDERPEHTDVFRLQSASAAVIESLLERRYPALSHEIRSRIAEFSDGNARIAILSAGHVHPGTNLADLGDEGLFERLFHQRRQADDPLLRAAEALALVYSFDGEASTGDVAELPFLARLVGLEVQALQRAAGELQRRDILQSRGCWRAILPQPLANWLAKRALQCLSPINVANAFWRCGNPRLLKSFTHRLSYLHDSVDAQRIAASWTAPEGPLGDLSVMAHSSADLRIDLVLHLAPVAPNAVLELVERCVMGSTPGQLDAATKANRQILISLLRKLAWFPRHFRRAALCLSRFAEAELGKGETTHTGYLEELFWPWLSGAQAGPHERLAVVQDLLVLPGGFSRDVGMIALRGMLTAGHFTSSHDFSFGGHAIDFGWRPTTLADYRDWYGGSLVIATRLALSDSPQRGTARHAIAEHFRSLWCFGHVFDQLEEAVLTIGTQEHWPQGWLAVRETLAFDRERMEPGLIARLESMKERLAPAGLRDRLRSYVLTEAYKIADTAHWETDGQYVQAHEAVIEEARRLGREAGRCLDQFDGDWPELFGPEAYQAGWFGEGLAETAADLATTWAELLERYRATDAERRNASLLGGFLRTAASKDAAKVNDLLDAAVSDRFLGPVFPYLQASVGGDEGGTRRLIASVETGLAPARAYGNLALGRTTEAMSSAALSRIVLGIASLPDGQGVAVEILSMHFHGGRGEQSAWDPLLIDCGRRLLASYPLDQDHHNRAYELAEIAKVCLSDTESATEAEHLCCRISDASANGRASWLNLNELIETLFSLHPFVALDCWFAGGQDEWRHSYMHFRNGMDNRNPLKRVPLPLLLQWANGDPETRFSRLAGTIPAFDQQDGATQWSEGALALLGAGPDRATVLQGLASQIHPRGWAGSLADILERRRPLFQAFLDDDDPALRQVARETDDGLQREIVLRRSHEAERDERFE